MGIGIREPLRAYAALKQLLNNLLAGVGVML